MYFQSQGAQMTWNMFAVSDFTPNAAHNSEQDLFCLARTRTAVQRDGHGPWYVSALLSKQSSLSTSAMVSVQAGWQAKER